MKKILLGFIAIGLLTFVGCGTSITDADGNTYTSVVIGEQEWMVENLRTTKYADGTPIPNVTDSNQWRDLKTGAWCNYENDSSQYEATYGKLYNWNAIKTCELCPTGWRVPTYEEWNVLEDYLTVSGHARKEGTALKAASGWDKNGNGTDAYGWVGLSSGYRAGYGNFASIGYVGHFWSSSEFNTKNAHSFCLLNSCDIVFRSTENKNFGFSVRCIKD
ncbi:MAG: hypothetical protein CMP63_06140 [Flavobacteriales bacterium]|nr:hypothetical protein [Flavobacteriales bacterium]|tara:strand:+ start:197 stop:850 length:654 start_codon:yes stop_codon:yes gene_type:complete